MLLIESLPVDPILCLCECPRQEGGGVGSGIPEGCLTCRLASEDDRGRIGCEGIGTFEVGLTRPKVLLFPAEGEVGDWGKTNVGLLTVGEVTRGRVLELE